MKIMMMMSRVMSCVVEGGNVPTIHMHMGIVGLVRCTIVPPPIRFRLSAEVVHYLIVRTETSSVGILHVPRGSSWCGVDAVDEVWRLEYIYIYYPPPPPLATCSRQGYVDWQCLGLLWYI